MSQARNLVGLSRQVLYEFEMAEFLAKRLVDLTVGPQDLWRDRFDTPKPLERQPFEINAMLEAHLIHVRALASFLFKSPPSAQRRASNAKRGKPGGLTDAYAEDFFDHPVSEWRRNPRGRPRRPAALSDAELKRISREVAHITYDRAEFPDEGPGWSAYGLYAALAPVMERFAAAVDASEVRPDFHERVRLAMPPAQPPAPTPHRPGGYSVTPPVPTQGLRPGSP